MGLVSPKRINLRTSVWMMEQRSSRVRPCLVHPVTPLALKSVGLQKRQVRASTIRLHESVPFDIVPSNITQLQWYVHELMASSTLCIFRSPLPLSPQVRQALTDPVSADMRSQ